MTNIFEGHHTAEFYGVKPCGNRLRMSLDNCFKVRDVKIIEERAHDEGMDHMEQLNAAPK